ncbi:MAG TPA: hypothetical protein VGS61_06960 [Acidimicrobiales bacterium]|nr:hypothetical protein [Acidimicrobiales bacterium]
MRDGRGLTPVRLAEVVGILLVMGITLFELHPNLIFSGTLITGGDTASHIALPAFLRSQGSLFNLTPWYPGWYAGMPAYTYYFVLPDFLATLGSYVIGFAVAMKLATILGSLLMPGAAYLMGRLFRAPRPVPIALAMATLPFLFDASYTIDGGNLFSTMAGEYAFSLSLAFAMVAIGLFARGMRTGRGYWVAAVLLSLTLAAHVLPWFFVIGAVVVMAVFEVLQRLGHGDPRDVDVRGDLARPVRFAVGAGLLSAGLSAWWLFGFATSQSYANSMGYTNDNTSTLHAVFTTLGWFSSTGGAAGDRWVIVGAALACVLAFVVRDRLGMILATLVVLSLAAFVFDPQSVIWNERLVPYWYISTHLAVGWLVGYVLYRWVARAATRVKGLFLYFGDGRLAFARVPIAPGGDDPDDDLAAQEGEDEADARLRDRLRAWREAMAAEDPAARVDRRTRRATVAAIVLGLASTLPGLVPVSASALGLNTTGNEVTSWAQWNYSGYQAKASWPEYRNIMTTMSHVAARYGCGRAMWEYNADQNRFGSPEALMLLPYWTNNCVDSMEGLLFESSATTPYHFLDQAELSASPSNPQVGLPYGPLDVPLGVEHLQMLGVKYYMAFTPSVVAAADKDPALTLVATTKKWPAPGYQWFIYKIADAPTVEPLAALPNVVSGVGSRKAWLSANVAWWLHPRLWGTLGAESGPSTWPRASSIWTMSNRTVTPTTVSSVAVHAESLSFDVTRLGAPVLVKVSYFPRWHASGALGPYRVSPNLMVVVPTSHHVTLDYGSTPALTIGRTVTILTGLGALVALGLALRRRRSALR